MRVWILPEDLNRQWYTENGFPTEQIFLHGFHDKVYDIVLSVDLFLVDKQNTLLSIFYKVILHDDIFILPRPFFRVVFLRPLNMFFLEVFHRKDAVSLIIKNYLWVNNTGFIIEALILLYLNLNFLIRNQLIWILFLWCKLISFSTVLNVFRLFFHKPAFFIIVSCLENEILIFLLIFGFIRILIILNWVKLIFIKLNFLTIELKVDCRVIILVKIFLEQVSRDGLLRLWIYPVNVPIKVTVSGGHIGLITMSIVKPLQLLILLQILQIQLFPLLIIQIPPMLNIQIHNNLNLSSFYLLQPRHLMPHIPPVYRLERYKRIMFNGPVTYKPSLMITEGMTQKKVITLLVQRRVPLMFLVTYEAIVCR